MIKYRFRIGDPKGLWAVFAVITDSREKAVELANGALGEQQEGSRLYVGSPARDGYANLEPGIRVDESMIVDESTADLSELQRMCAWLATQGFEYRDPERLLEDEEPSFTKALYTEDGEGIYGWINVEVSWDFNIEAYSYRIGAVLYPVGLARTLEKGDRLRYGVQFHSRQAYITADELPKLLPLYEVKYRKLITVLRDADPIDGLPNQMPDGIE